METYSSKQISSPIQIIKLIYENIILRRENFFEVICSPKEDIKIILLCSVE